MSSEPILAVVFFRTELGREPAREWLQSLDRDDRRVIGEDIKVGAISLALRHAARQENRNQFVGSA